MTKSSRKPPKSDEKDRSRKQPQFRSDLGIHMMIIGSLQNPARKKIPAEAGI